MESGDLRQIGVGREILEAIERERRSFGESENDILRRLLVPALGDRGSRGRDAAEPGRRAPEPADPLAAGPRGTRRRGLWSVELGGRRLAAENLKQAYRILLCALDAVHPDFLEAFARERDRARRFVARDPAALYGRSPHLAPRHAQPLVGGWYFDSNVSATQVARRVRIAARLCGLLYGQDVRILDNLREL